MNMHHHEEDRWTEADLDAVAAHCDAATDGPWESCVEGRDHSSGDSLIMTGGEDLYLHGATVADQDFIAHARQGVPRLLAEVRRLRHAARQGGT